MMGEMLWEIQQTFGPRDPGLTILGVEFADVPLPCHWFPRGRNYVVIQLQIATMRDKARAYFQMAHECVHLLDPGGGTANVLEEGLATWFAFKFTRQTDAGHPKYQAAAQFASDLMQMDPGAVKSLRSQAFESEGLRLSC
jgi:hypothetical protein